MSQDQELIPHIDYAGIPKKHTSTYLMHKFWARKPYNMVSDFIKHYSKRGEIVLDPFCGSGVTIIEAMKSGRKAIGIDLDPLATFVTKMTVLPVDLAKFEQTFKEIESKVKDTCMHETIARVPAEKREKQDTLEKFFV